MQKKIVLCDTNKLLVKWQKKNTETIKFSNKKAQINSRTCIDF